MLKNKTFLLLLLSLTTGSAAHAIDEGLKPKYGPEAKVLSRSNEYIRRAPAPDYWALSPYYVPQQDGRSCSLASVTMVVNAARSGVATRPPLGSDDELATQPTVFKRVDSEVWKKGLGPIGRGVTLDQLGVLMKDSLKVYGLETVKLEVVHVEDPKAAGVKSLVRKALEANEKSAKDFIIANFDQGVFTGDAQAGHIAPVGAYDAKTRRVLILDPDRQWYEPYWVSEETFIKAMATQDGDAGRKRGFVWVSVK
jgi:hypothetical protein